MAWASKKQYAILMSSEEGKDLAEQLGEMEQDEFNKKFSELLGKSGQSSNDTSKQKESANATTNKKRKIETIEDEENLEKEVVDMINQGKSNVEIKNYLEDTTEDFDWWEADEWIDSIKETLEEEKNQKEYENSEEARLKRIAEHRYRTNPNLNRMEDIFDIGDFTGYLGYGSLEALEEATFGKKEQPKEKEVIGAPKSFIDKTNKEYNEAINGLKKYNIDVTGITEDELEDEIDSLLNEWHKDDKNHKYQEIFDNLMKVQNKLYTDRFVKEAPYGYK